MAGSTPSAPNEHGVQQTDIHFIITLTPSHEFSTTVNGVKFPAVQPIGCMRVDYNVWRQAPQRSGWNPFGTSMVVANLKELVRWFMRREDIWLGRRINDDIEMFEEGMKEEYATLRHDLQAKGLTVRPYIPAPQSSNKFPHPTYKAILGADKDSETTCLARSLKSLANTIANCANQTGVKIEHGLLGSVPVPAGTRPLLAIARVPEELADAKTVTRTDPMGGVMEIAVIGRIKDGVPSFDEHVGEDIVRGFFDSVGKVPDGEKVMLLDRVKEREEELKEEARVRKKTAKRERQRAATGSTGASGPLQSNGGQAEDEEVAKARRKAKMNQKRKAQNQRRKEAKEAGIKAAEIVVDLVNSQDKKKKKQEEEKEDDEDVETIPRTMPAKKEEHTGPTYLRLPTGERDDNGDQICVYIPIDDDTYGSQEPEKLGLGGEESTTTNSSDSSTGSEKDGGEDEEGVAKQEKGLEVIVVHNAEEMEQALRERPGRQIATATFEEAAGLGIEGLTI